MVGVAGFAGLSLYVIGRLVAGGSSVGSADSVAEQLTAFSAGDAGFVIGQLLQVLAMVALAVVLFEMFRAARARNEAMNNALIGLTIIAPLLVIAFTVAPVIGVSGVASDFEDVTVPTVQPASDLKELQTTIADDPESIDRIIFETGDDVQAIEYRTTDGDFFAVSYSDDDQLQEVQDAADAAEIENDSDDQAEPGELQAEQLTEDSSLAGLAPMLFLLGGVTLAIAGFYTARMAMRVGLQTQFWGTFGMAGSVAAVILGPIGALGWAVNAGLVYSGWAVNRRPPGWDAGEARPWPRPGAPAGGDEDDGDEPARPEDFEGTASETTSPDRSNRREARRKRKRKQRGS